MAMIGFALSGWLTFNTEFVMLFGGRFKSILHKYESTVFIVFSSSGYATRHMLHGNVHLHPFVLTICPFYGHLLFTNFKLYFGLMQIHACYAYFKKKIIFDRKKFNYDVKTTSFTFKFSPGAVADFHSDLLLLHIYPLLIFVHG